MELEHYIVGLIILFIILCGLSAKMTIMYGDMNKLRHNLNNIMDTVPEMAIDIWKIKNPPKYHNGQLVRAIDHFMDEKIVFGKIVGVDFVRSAKCGDSYYPNTWRYKIMSHGDTIKEINEEYILLYLSENDDKDDKINTLKLKIINDISKNHTLKVNSAEGEILFIDVNVANKIISEA